MRGGSLMLRKSAMLYALAGFRGGFSPACRFLVRPTSGSSFAGRSPAGFAPTGWHNHVTHQRQRISGGTVATCSPGRLSLGQRPGGPQMNEPRRPVVSGTWVRCRPASGARRSFAGVGYGYAQNSRRERRELPLDVPAFLTALPRSPDDGGRWRCAVQAMASPRSMICRQGNSSGGVPRFTMIRGR